MTQLARFNLLAGLFFGCALLLGSTAFALDAGDGSASGAVSVDSDQSPHSDTPSTPRDDSSVNQGDSNQTSPAPSRKYQTSKKAAKRYDADYNATSVDPPAPPTQDDGAPAGSGGSPNHPANNAGDTGTL